MATLRAVPVSAADRALDSHMADHDNAYKHLFSHHEIVRDLLEGFVHEPWVAQLNLRSLKKEPASYVSNNLRARHGDMVWRVPLGKRRTLLRVLLEFQSTVDASMAVRMLTYAGLLYQDLIRSGGARARGPLPPVLPIVLYNGRRRWHAAGCAGDQIQTCPAGLKAYQPRMRYLLIDIARYSSDELARMRNLAAAVFRLENSRTSAEVDDVIRSLDEWQGRIEQSDVRNAFKAWLKSVIIPRNSRVQSAPVYDLEERSMSLAEAAEDWRAKYRGEGRLEGRREGQLEGQRQGRLDGERQILSRQLQKRFGVLPSAVMKCLQQAQSEDLERWAERLLDARSLAELFDGETVEA